VITYTTTAGALVKGNVPRLDSLIKRIIITIYLIFIIVKDIDIKFLDG
jgi:hypothetical protein